MITDSSKIPRETHYACPHCMTKIEIVTEDTKVIDVKATANPHVFDLTSERARAYSHLEEPNIVEIISNKKSAELSNESRERPKEQTWGTSEFQCSYYFGFLREKGKNEVVPETCFGCSKSIDCMLSEFNKSQKSLEEIKKWYFSKS